MKKLKVSNNKKRGCDAERKYAKMFREEFGQTKCKTTREASRLLDSCKIDLVNTGFNIQIKKGYLKARPKGEEIFSDMESLLLEHYPVGDVLHNLPKVLIHEMDSKNTLVTMPLKDWKKLITYYYKHHEDKIYNNQCL